MDAERYRRLEELFDEAVDLEGLARDEYLARECAGDSQLRAEIERLLARDTGDACRGLAPAPPSGAAPCTPVPERIGRYLVQGRIAEGGMGAVYLARQEHPDREVAIKVIHPGLVTDELLRRFRFEAELLGRLQHSGIAQIFEAGEADIAGGRQPFIAMEHIRGAELRAYAAEHELTITERVELLARVCDAVSHAHQKGIVHRDLKPQNVLVVEPTTGSTPSGTGRGARFANLGQPKVLDFGISRLVRESADEATVLTRPGHVLGTPAYMSPEQAGGDREVDVRSDVYSLGVLGFELLAGRLPHDLEDAPLLDALRTIRERPAPRLDSISRELRGDLTILIGKALEPERERRYASAAAMAEDLRRYLADEPIVARSPTLRYQLTRFVRRNRLVVAASLLAFAGLVIGLVLALLAQREEMRQRQVAETRTVEAQRAAYSAQLQAARALRLGGEPEAARELLEAAPVELRGWEWRYEAAFAGEALYRSRMELPVSPKTTVAANESRALFPVGPRTLRLFDFTTRATREISYPGQEEAVGGVIALLPGQPRALWGDPQGRIRFLDLDRETALPVLAELRECVVGLALLAGTDCAVVLTSKRARPSPTATISVVDLGSGVTLRRRGGLPDGYALAVSADGRRLAIGSSGFGTGRVQVLDAASLATQCECEAHDGAVRVLAFSTDGRWLASVGLDLSVRAWDFGAEPEPRLVGRVSYVPYSLCFHPDGRLASGHMNGLIQLWDVEEARCLEVISGAMRPDPAHSSICQLSWDENGEVLRAVGLDGVRAHLLSPRLASVLPHRRGVYPFASDVAFAPCGRYLATAGWDGTVRLWDAATRSPITVLDCAVNALLLAFSPAGDRLLVCSQLGYGAPVLRLFDTRTWHLLAECTGEGASKSMCYVPANGSVLLGSLEDLRVIDPGTLAVTSKRQEFGGVASLALSPDGKDVVLGLWDGRLAILEAATLQRRGAYPAHAAPVRALAFSADGSLLATGGSDERVLLFDSASWRPRSDIRIPNCQDVLGLRFHADGNRLFVGSRRKSIGVYEIPSGVKLGALRGHEGYVNDLAWSPDGRVLASASGDCTVRLWDARSRREQVTARRRMLAAEDRVRLVVDALVGEGRSIEEVLAAIEANDALGEIERYAAWVLLHRGRGR